MIDALKLVKEAIGAREKSYCPYSHFAVGAALIGKSGRVYTGCNIESASFGATVCAERAAFAKAISDGERRFEAIAIAGAPEGELVSGECFPCGICRQFMAEFCTQEPFTIVLADSPHTFRAYTLGELFPHGFSLKE